MSTETVFDIVQTPLIGLIVGLVLYFQLRKQQNVQRPIVWSVVGGLIAAAGYGAIKFLF